MTTRRSIVQALRSTSRSHWGEAGVLTCFTLLGGIAPLWIGWLILRANQAHPHLLDFARNGEFALYSAALLAPALYLVVHDRNDTPFAGRSLFVLFSTAGTLMSVACYTMAAPETGKVVNLLHLDRDFIGFVTLGLFCASLLLSLVVTTLDNARTNPDVQTLVDRQEKDLADDYDRLK